MRILWITPGFAAGEQDFNCIPPLQILARTLVDQGVDLHIIPLEYPFSNHPYPVSAAGGQVYPCNGRNRRWLRWRTEARARSTARKIISKEKCAAIHSFWLGPAWVLGEQISARWQTPHLTTLMGQDVQSGSRYLRSVSAQTASRMVALTPFHQSSFFQHTGLHTGHCIPWGIAQSDIPASLTGERTIDVLGVGSLLPVKDWARWLRIIKQVAGHFPNIRATLIGGGPEAAALQALAHQLGIAAKVQFAGTLPRPEVLERMRQSRVLLHTAKFESFGYVLAEAAVNGCRVVSTPVGTGPAMGVCADSDALLASAVVDALRATTPPAPVQPLRMEDTAAAYMQLYQAL